MKNLLTLSFLFLVLSVLNANPPLPDAGKRWVLNPNYSDEFNGTSLDKTKWYDYHPTWKGREPGLFMPEMVQVKNGYLKLSDEKMDKDTVITSQWSGSQTTYNVKCAAVVSIHQTAHYGYYECRAKAATNTMSLTFWFSNRKSFDGPEACSDKFSQEWDIHESIGREGDFQGSWFAKGMHSNAHYWYTDCGGEKHDYRADDVRYENDKLSSEAFNIYGGWWHDATRATYYYNNADPKEQTFYTGVTDQPMAQPMGMNLVHETYPSPWISLPTDRELADTSMNYALYDWVRAYVQVDADEPSPYTQAPHLNLYDEKVAFVDGRMALDAAQVMVVPLSFKCNTDRYVTLTAYNADNVVVAEAHIKAYEGYTHYEAKLDFGQLPYNGSYTLIAELKESEKATSYISSERSSLLVSGGTALHEIKQSGMMILPNPVGESLKIEGGDVLGFYQIYNLHGQEVLVGELDKNEIDVTKLDRGWYILNAAGYSQKFQKM